MKYIFSILRIWTGYRKNKALLMVCKELMFKFSLFYRCIVMILHRPDSAPSVAEVRLQGSGGGR